MYENQATQEDNDDAEKSHREEDVNNIEGKGTVTESALNGNESALNIIQKQDQSKD